MSRKAFDRWIHQLKNRFKLLIKWRNKLIVRLFMSLMSKKKKNHKTNVYFQDREELINSIFTQPSQKELTNKMKKLIQKLVHTIFILWMKIRLFAFTSSKLPFIILKLSKIMTIYMEFFIICLMNQKLP